jgi:hypothetical protein
MKVNGSKVLLYTYYLLILVGITVPSDGSHGLLSPKSLVFLGTLFAFSSYLLFNQRIKEENLSLFIFLGYALPVLGLFLVIGMGYPASAIDQFKLFIITLFVPLVSLYLITENVLKATSFFKFIIYFSFLFSILKVSLTILNVFHIIDLFSLMEKVGIRFMSMGIYGGIGRVQTSVDIVTPFILFVALMNRSLGLNLSRVFFLFFIPFTWLALLLSFSRYLLMAALFAHFCYWMTLNHKKLIFSLFRFSCLVALFIMMIGPEKVYQVVERRFFSEHSEKSDDIRKIQISNLIEGFFTAPVLGKGMGGFTEEGVRDQTLKHSYEVQWVAFLMQFGLLGLIAISIPLLAIAYLFLKPPLTRVKFSFLIMFLVWLLSGFTNPFLISLTSGVIYAIFCIAGYQLIALQSYSWNPPSPYQRPLSKLIVHKTNTLKI